MATFEKRSRCFRCLKVELQNQMCTVWSLQQYIYLPFFLLIYFKAQQTVVGGSPVMGAPPDFNTLQ